MSKFEIRHFSSESLELAKQRWKNYAGDDEFAIEYEPFFGWCATHITPIEEHSQAWELFNNDSQQCDAIVDIVNSKQGKLHKLLKLYVSPQYWTDTGKHRDEIIKLHIDAFVLAIQKGLLGGAKNVKLYGRSDLMLSILHSIHATWSVPNTTAEFHGRFLTISIAD